MDDIGFAWAADDILGVEDGPGVVAAMEAEVEVGVKVRVENGPGVVVKMEAEVEVELKVRVDEVQLIVVEVVEVSVEYRLVSAIVGVAPASTTVYVDFGDDLVNRRDVDKVTLILTVLAGSDVLTSAVDTIVSVEAGKVTAGAVTVSVWSEV